MPADLGRDLHRGSRIGRLSDLCHRWTRSLPARSPNRSLFEHVDFVRRSNCNCSARSALTDDGRNEGVVSARQACVQRAIASACPRSSAPIRVSPGRVDREITGTRIDGHIEQALHLAVTLRQRHAEIVLERRLGVVAFPADDGNGRPRNRPKPVTIGLVFAIQAVPASGVKSAISLET
jgi:hypothetical protein